jgi:histidine triad (HIT) family protein
MPSIFTKIMNGEIPGYKIAETAKFFAFLDVFPLVDGHVLVVPKKKTDYIFDMENEDLSDMIIFAKSIAVGLKKAVPCKRIGMSVIGLEVPHAHIHLVPMNSANDLNFTREKLKPSGKELAEMQEKIKSFL